MIPRSAEPRVMRKNGRHGRRVTAAVDLHATSESTLLPGEPHGDPADRFLIAAARTEGVILATRDENIVDYGNAGHVRVLEL